MLSFALYVIGSIVCIAGIAWIATLLGAAPAYVSASAALLLVIAIVSAAARRRAVEPPAF
jgi:hypothetical protein